jgi:hypothetical protein
VILHWRHTVDLQTVFKRICCLLSISESENMTFIYVKSVILNHLWSCKFFFFLQTSITNSSENMFTPDRLSNEFLADFGLADPFNSSTQSASVTSQPSFANFENNPIFNSSSKYYFQCI